MRQNIRFIFALFVSVVLALTATTVLAMDKVPSEVTLFKNVNVFDGKSDKLLMGQDVLVVKNLIKKIGKDIPTSATYEVETTSG